MKKYLQKTRDKREAIKKHEHCFLEVGILENSQPALFCDGKLVQNTYTVEIRHNQEYGSIQGSIKTEVSSQFVCRRDLP